MSLQRGVWGFSVAGLGVVWACATGTADDDVGGRDASVVVPSDAGHDAPGDPLGTDAALPFEDASDGATPSEDATTPVSEDSAAPVGEDASSEDSGEDAGGGSTDAGHDAGHDAGTKTDAGGAVDSGTDSGVDASTGQDAGCSPASIVINEVQTAGTGGAQDEWVELYNPSSCAVSIAGWVLKHTSTTGTTEDTVWTAAAGTTLAAGGWGIVAGTAYTGGGTPIGSFTSGVLAPDGGGLGLYNASAALIDSMGYGAGATNPFVQTAPAAAPPSAESTARTPNGASSHDNATDFATATTPTPGSRN